MGGTASRPLRNFRAVEAHSSRVTTGPQLLHLCANATVTTALPTPARSFGSRLWLHRYAMFVVATILLLIFFGGQVKSTEAGLSVPDWPNTYGHFMFSFPWEKMVGGIFWEHSHRMIASIVGLLTFALTIWVYRVDPRVWVRRVSLAASIAVLVQGVMGGLTVLLLLPVWASSTHGTLAQIYLCLVVVIAMATSARWVDRPERATDSATRPLRRLALMTTAAIFLQLVIGAIMRHSEAGLVIPDFPTMFGSWLPPLSDAAITDANEVLWREDLLWRIGLSEVTRGHMIVHLLHRAWAVVVTALILSLFVRVMRHWKSKAEIRRPATLLMVLVVVQITLGILTILTEKQFTVTTLHVLVGAMTLATSFGLSVLVLHLLAPARAHQTRMASGIVSQEVAA